MTDNIRHGVFAFVLVTAVAVSWLWSEKLAVKPFDSLVMVGAHEGLKCGSESGRKGVDLFRLSFVEERANVIFLGLVGLGKNHLATALGYAACQRGMGVLFANAIDVINTLNAARARGALKTEMRKYTSPALLILEIGYLPIAQRGADLLFQVISARYERGSIVLTTNKPFKQWATIFNGDATITSAVLDRLLHHDKTVVLEGTSYRMKDCVES